jgi:predicted metal-dependent hydrolase
VRAASKTIEVKGVGPVLLERSRLAKRIVISVKPSGVVRVAVPCRSSFEQAEEFAGGKAEWIKRQLTKVKQVKRCLSPASPRERQVARERLTERLKHLAAKHGFKYNRVFIRDQKARWGSCSNKNNISLSIRLASLPGELMDYVILHELTHTRQKDHSWVFWAEMDKLVGDGRRMARRMRVYSLR